MKSLVAYGCAAVVGAAVYKLVDTLLRRRQLAAEAGAKARRESAVRFHEAIGSGSSPTASPKLRRAETLDTLLRPKAAADSTTNGVIVIGIAGGSASGKSYYCKRLREICEAVCWCTVLAHDMYYKDQWQVDKECGGDWDCPQALHTHELVEDIDKLLARQAVKVPYYDFTTSSRDAKRAEALEPPPRGELMVVLVEGLMVFHSEELRNRCHFRVFIDCDEDTRFMRRLARDTGAERDRSVASVYGVWAEVVKPAHHKYIEPTKRHAHLVVPSTRVHADVGHLHRRNSLHERATSGGGTAKAEKGSSDEDNVLTELPSLMMMRAYITQCRDECREEAEE